MQKLQFLFNKVNTTRKNVLWYVLSFFTTFLLLFLFHTYYNIGCGNPLANSLSITNILLNSVASLCAMLYLKHTNAFSLTHSGVCFLLSITYGMCSYGIVQENLTAALCLYAFFPILFLCYEKMISGKLYLPFIITMALALIVHPEGALPIFFLLVILSIFDLILQRKMSLGNYMHILSCMVLAFLLGAFRILSYLATMYPASYSGYSTSYPFLMLLSRFLPFGSVSISFSTENGIDVYAGLFLLILLIVFFVSKKICTAKKLAYGFFMLLAYAVITVSPLRFLFCLFTESGRFSVYFSFFIIFWIFRLGAEAASVIHFFTLSETIQTFCLTLCYIFVCFISFRHNFTVFAFPAMIILTVFYCYLLFSLKKKDKFLSIPMVCLFLLFLAELTGNTIITTNLDFYPDQRSTTASYIWSGWENRISSDYTDSSNDASNTAVSSDESTDTYAQFLSAHQNEEDIAILDNLLAEVSLDDSEYEELCGSSLPDIFMEINAAAKKIGCKDAIFTPASISISFEESENYSISDLSNNVFYFYGDQSENRSKYYIVPFQFHLNEKVSGDLYFSNDSTNEFFSYNEKQLSDSLEAYTFLVNNKGYGMTFHISAYILNHDALQKASYLLEQNMLSQDSTQRNLAPIYTGIILSCIGLLIFFVFYFNSDKDKVYAFMLAVKEKISKWCFPKKVLLHIEHNRIYYLAFLLPVIVFFAAMIINDCTPFGENSFFSGDGTALTLPSYWDCYHNLKSGNTYLSLNGGYGTNQYASHPFIGLLSILCLFKMNQIPALLLILESICLGFCGLSMVFYLTHRTSGKAAKKTDYRLLVPAAIYSLNAYMIAMHDFTSWYFVLLAFPLLMAAFERMIYKKKTLPYVLLLTFCISSNLYLALYICIFLVIYFFTCHFEGIKGFINKGVRFALCSILAAGNSFFIISNTLLSSSDSLYRETDSVFPAFGLHTSFLEQWKQQMMFTVSHSVTNNNGMANLYYGIITFFFILIYLCSKKYSWKDKLRKFIPVIILYISFNEQVLSYLWNGFHYQTKVPNRFVFLLMFLVAIIAYDGICQLKKVSISKFLGITVTIIAFLLICQFGTSGEQNIAWITSLAICIICFLFFIIFKKRNTVWLTKGIILLLTTELCINSIYSLSNVGLYTILLYGNYTENTEFINELEKNAPHFRTAFPATVNALTNSGSVLDTYSTDLFNSYVTAHQNNLNTLLGFYSNGNVVKNQNNSTPLGLSLAGVRYIFLSNKLMHNINNLSCYNYLGQKDIFYVYENPNALSLGFYVPDEVLNLEVSVDDPIKFSNDFVSAYMAEDNQILVRQQIKYNSDTSEENSFIFTDTNGNMMEVEKAYEYYDSDEDTSDISNLHLRINFTSQIDGLSYLYAKEFVGIGESETEKPQVYDIAFPNQLTDFVSEFDVVTLNEELLNNFCNMVKQNQLENIETGNDMITASTNYEKEGYTMFSLAYDKGWHAYIDGEEVPIEDPYDAMMFIKTPAGKHTITLKYIPYGMHTGYVITLAFWSITIILYIWIYRRKHTLKEK